MGRGTPGRLAQARVRLSGGWHIQGASFSCLRPRSVRGQGGFHKPPWLGGRNSGTPEGWGLCWEPRVTGHRAVHPRGARRLYSQGLSADRLGSASGASSSGVWSVRGAAGAPRGRRGVGGNLPQGLAGRPQSASAARGARALIVHEPPRSPGYGAGRAGGRGVLAGDLRGAAGSQEPRSRAERAGPPRGRAQAGGALGRL